MSDTIQSALDRDIARVIPAALWHCLQSILFNPEVVDNLIEALHEYADESDKEDYQMFGMVQVYQDLVTALEVYKEGHQPIEDDN